MLSLVGMQSISFGMKIQITILPLVQQRHLLWKIVAKLLTMWMLMGR